VHKFACVMPCEPNAMIVLLSRCIIYNLVKCVATTRLLFSLKIHLMLYHQDCELEAWKEIVEVM
jgi:hypothetical protein